jgi:orotate phosphoribosyltransferase
MKIYRAPSTMKKRLAEIILARTFRFTSKPSFTLASGRKSSFYFNCKPTTLSSEGLYLTGNLLFGIMKKKPAWRVKGVGGLTLGADPIANAIAYTAHIKGERLESFVVRKEPKKHGTMLWIEGAVEKGDRVLVVEDVITTGGSSKKAVERARKCGLKVVGLLALIDRQEGGREVIESMGIPFQALFTKEDIFGAYKKKNSK